MRYYAFALYEPDKPPHWLAWCDRIEVFGRRNDAVAQAEGYSDWHGTVVAVDLPDPPPLSPAVQARVLRTYNLPAAEESS